MLTHHEACIDAVLLATNPNNHVLPKVWQLVVCWEHGLQEISATTPVLCCCCRSCCVSMLSGHPKGHLHVQLTQLCAATCVSMLWLLHVISVM
jgi:hypothetical protein